ncbi:asparaginyl-tRNA synthetase [Rhizina undulata]
MIRTSNCSILHRALQIRQLSSSAATLPRTVASLLHPAQDSAISETQRGTENGPPIVTINGWIRSVRRMKNVSFAHVSDGSTLTALQAVLTKEQSEGLSTGSSVQITGEWKESVKGSTQKRELLAQEVTMLGEADPNTYPLQKKYHTPEFLRTLPHLRPRIPSNSTLLRARSFIVSRLTNFFQTHEFVQCHPPIITSSDCEGAGEVFTVSSNASAPGEKATHFFKTPKYMTVSSQLHLEAFSAALPRVWTLSPTFRAEKSDTARHLSEFYMLEAEVSFIDSLDPLLSFIEDMTKDIVSTLFLSRIGEDVLEATGEETRAELESRWKGLLSARWTRMTYTEAIEKLKAAVDNGEAKFMFPVTWGASLQAEHEKFLAENFGGEGNGGPIFITDYPRKQKPFYMLPSSESMEKGRETVACFDLLLPSVGELVGGSLREHRFDALVASMRQHGLIPAESANVEDEQDLGNLKWYTDLRKWGSVKHGGFGLGFERLLCYLCGVENIREASAFPRWAGRCDC